MFNASLPKAGTHYTASDALPLMLDPSGHFTGDAARLTREKVGNIRGPVFLVQGDQPLYPGGPEHIRVQDEILVPELESAGIELYRKVYPGQQHCFAYLGTTGAALEAFEDIDAFIREHVPTKPTPIGAEYVQNVSLNEPLPSAIDVSDEILQDYAGSYVLENGAGRIEMVRDGADLAAEMAGQPRLLLRGESETVFYGNVEPETIIEFVRNNDGGVTHFIVNGDLRADRE